MMMMMMFEVLFEFEWMFELRSASFVG